MPKRRPLRGAESVGDPGEQIVRIESVREAAPVLFFERVGPGLAKYPYSGWVTFSLVIALTSVALAILSGRMIFWTTGLILAFGVAVIPFAVKLGLRILLGWQSAFVNFVREDREVVESWYREHLARLCGLLPPAMVGILFVPLALLSFSAGSYFRGLSRREFFVVAGIISLAAFASGVAMYLLLNLARIVRDVGRFRVFVAPHGFGVMSIGSGLLRCYLIAAGVWLVISLSGTWRMYDSLPPVVFIGAPSLFVILGSFVFCQLPLHRRMLEYKEERLYEVDRAIRALEPLRPEELTDERVRALEYFERERQRVSSLPEWPFGWRIFTGVIASSVVPVIPGVIQLFLTSMFTP